MNKFIMFGLLVFVCGCSCSDSGLSNYPIDADSSAPDLDSGNVVAGSKDSGSDASSDASWIVHEGPGGSIVDSGDNICSDSGDDSDDGSEDDEEEQDHEKSNNGHGNNCDGVDVSNPGRGHGGPSGRYDLSNHFDDECKKFRN